MKRLGIGVLIILTIATLCVASAQAAQISVEPAYQEVFRGDIITVNITVYPDESEIYGASYTLYFNNTILNATSWTQGPFLTQDGNSSSVWVHEIDNALGKVEYAECRMNTTVGVTDLGVLTTITFQAIGVKGVSLLNISDLDGELLCSTSGSILTDVNNGSVGIAQMSIPFLVYGYVSYENDSECNNPTVNLTNLNISKEWAAETNDSSNYYQIMLASGVDVIAGETLQFNVTSLDGNQSNVTEHTVTLEEIRDGGIINFNITLLDTTAPASITNLQNTTYEQTYINWTWNDPTDADFSKVMLYLNGTFKTNVTKGVQHYNATGLTPDTDHVIATHTVDESGNINETWVNDSARTKPSPDTTPPGSITNLQNTTYEQTYINWTWNVPDKCSKGNPVLQRNRAHS